MNRMMMFLFSLISVFFIGCDVAASGGEEEVVVDSSALVSRVVFEKGSDTLDIIVIGTDTMTSRIRPYSVGTSYMPFFGIIEGLEYDSIIEKDSTVEAVRADYIYEWIPYSEGMVFIVEDHTDALNGPKKLYACEVTRIVVDGKYRNVYIRARRFDRAWLESQSDTATVSDGVGSFFIELRS